MSEKQQRIANIISERKAKLLYKGKSKDVYELPNGNVLMVFGDAFTGAAGVADPGANRNIGRLEGLGHRNLEVSEFIFEQIAKNTGIPTHHTAVDLQNDILEAVKVSIFAKGLPFIINGKNFTADGLEVISRNIACGSYLNRFPDTMKGEKIGAKTGEFVEFTLKNDEAGDPFVSAEQLIEYGVCTKTEYETITANTQKIAGFLTELFKKAGMELLDFKVEFGKDKHGNVLLADEISPGSLRVAVKGQEYPDKEKVYGRLMELKKLQGGESKGGNAAVKPMEIAAAKKKPVVGVYMGSDSDMPVMNKALKILKRFGIPYEVDISSAHRTPDKMRSVALSAEEKGLKVIIAGAGGGAAHLPGMIASYTAVPVIGVPIGEKSVSSVLMMPAGVPVAAVKADEAFNAGILAAQIVGSCDPAVRRRVKQYKEEMAKDNEIKSKNLSEYGVTEYMAEFLK